MPLLRFSLYSQNVNLYLAPTADARDTWLPLMRTIACEGRAFVLSANQCTRRKHLPDWIKDSPKTEANNGTINGSYDYKDKPLQRESSVTKTEDNHEISWPSPETKADLKTGSLDDELPVQPLNAGSDFATSGDQDRHKMNVDSVSKEVRRRSSTVSKLPDKHLLALPVSTTGKPPVLSDENPSSSTEEEFVCRGGSCIIGPTGDVLAGPLWEVDNGSLLIVRDVDFEDCERGRLDLDVAGSYSRNDAFSLEVEGLDITPPP